MGSNYKAGEPWKRNWREFFERGKMVFENHAEKPATALERQVGALEEKLARKNDVLAELMEEHVALKKSLGETIPSFSAFFARIPRGMTNY